MNDTQRSRTVIFQLGRRQPRSWEARDFDTTYDTATRRSDKRLRRRKSSTQESKRSSARRLNLLYSYFSRHPSYGSMPVRHVVEQTHRSHVLPREPTQEYRHCHFVTVNEDHVHFPCDTDLATSSICSISVMGVMRSTMVLGNVVLASTHSFRSALTCPAICSTTCLI